LRADIDHPTLPAEQRSVHSVAIFRPGSPQSARNPRSRSNPRGPRRRTTLPAGYRLCELGALGVRLSQSLTNQSISASLGQTSSRRHDEHDAHEAIFWLTNLVIVVIYRGVVRPGSERLGRRRIDAVRRVVIFRPGPPQRARNPRSLSNPRRDDERPELLSTALWTRCTLWSAFSVVD
jgi:hypothetical protein